MACPYFAPVEIRNDGCWQHPARLPLGAGWSGHCCADEAPIAPDDVTLREFCNLGNATSCPHLPFERDWDAVRFSVARTSAGQITLWYVCELAHAPMAHGKLTFDCVSDLWLNPHSDVRVQRLADCYLRSHRSRQNGNSNIAERIGA